MASLEAGVERIKTVRSRSVRGYIVFAFAIGLGPGDRIPDAGDSVAALRKRSLCRGPLTRDPRHYANPHRAGGIPAAGWPSFSCC